MAIELSNGVVLQDIPESVLSLYSYIIITRVSSNSNSSYIQYRLSASNSPFSYVKYSSNNGNIEISEDGAETIMSLSQGVAHLTNTSGGTTWIEEKTFTSHIYPITISNLNYNVVWSNHDIYKAIDVIELGGGDLKIVAGNEIYFANSLDMVITSDSHYKAIASKVREILGEATQYKPRELPAAIRNTSGVLNRYDISTGVTFRNGEASIMGDTLYPGLYTLNDSIITIPKHIVEIAPYALYNAAYYIEQLVFNEGLTKIGDFAFYGLHHLTGEIILPESLNTIGEQAFRNGKFTSVIIPKNVTKIGRSAFYSCSDLEEVTILSDKIDALDWTFDYCKKLKRVDIKGNVSKINSYTFSHCESLETLILRGSFTSLPYITAFQYSSIKNGTGYIYVPSALLNQYKTTKTWSTYAAQFRAIEDYPEICNPTE